MTSGACVRAYSAIHKMRDRGKRGGRGSADRSRSRPPLKGAGYFHTALPRMAPRPGVFQWSTTITFLAFTYQTRWV